ncbi:MAG: hypothetical protein IPM54_13300 [Polyangiaceae bacterium]|nr:hypothetical protein [Polyangiaceae bacterium]
MCALVAAALSAAYVALYLRGGPRIIDATSYFLEARALAEGHLAFRLDEPVASTLGRFLVRTDGADGSHAAVIFPPGYPALLALGFVLGHPLVIGPLLAAGITCTTWALARAVSPGETSSTPSIPRLAALFSVACAALRYHTADTMSHGLSALCFSGALVFALSAARAIHDHRSATWPSIAAGLFAGWLAATRPVSALALGITLAAVLASACRAHPRATLRLFASALLGSLPGLALLVAHQHAATGAFFASSQTAYYAVSDGPPDCFRYGFGAGIGCIGEHGEFVQRNLTHGYGAFAAAATTLRRLKQHLVDAGNSEPFTLVVLAGAVIAFRDPRLRFLPIGVLAQIAVYVPFYFDGNYPGGGARFYADVLPLEHVLAAIAVARFPPLSTVWRGGRGVRPSPPLHLWRGGRGVRPSAVLALVPLGFAFRAGFDHAALRDRDGGRPMFEPSRLPNVEAPALLFVDTDHGFNLAFDPDKHGQASTSNSLTSNPWHVARLRGDALDLMTWQKHGKPAAYRYLFPLGVDHPDVRVVPYDIASSTTLGIEAENLWPPIAQDQGYALASWPNAPCASARRWLVVTPVSSDKPASITLALPAPFLAGRRIAARIGFEAAASASVSWVVDGQTVHSTRVSAADQSEREHSSSARCVTLPAFEVPEVARTLSIIVLRDAGLPADALVALDRIDIEEPKRR